MNKTITISEDTYELIKDQLTQNERVDLSKIEDLVGKNGSSGLLLIIWWGKLLKLLGIFCI